MHFCDTHIHLLAPAWRLPVEARLEQARAAGIELLLQPGVSSSGWNEMLELAKRFPQVYAAPGLHPMCAAEWNDTSAAALRECCTHAKVLVIGEIGLDAICDVDSQVQQAAFTGQLAVANQLGRPVLIHCRKRTGALLDLLQKVDFRHGGLWHGFSGSLETARKIIDLGFGLGIGPVLLRNNARKLPEVIRQIDAQALVLETDAPDMADRPDMLLAVAKKLAALRGWTLAECARITSENARRTLRVDKE